MTLMNKIKAFLAVAKTKWTLWGMTAIAALAQVQWVIDKATDLLSKFPQLTTGKAAAIGVTLASISAIVLRVRGVIADTMAKFRTPAATTDTTPQ